jgi:hypothetical protein
MTSSAAEPPIATAPAASPHAGIPRLNPLTGLSTDYLNHFTEAAMVLEMLPAMPDCITDFLAWEPKSYREHFATSHFSDREGVIAAYDTADPALRRSLETLAEVMNTLLVATREAIAANPAGAKTQVLAQRAAASLKPIITRCAAIINGSALSSGVQAPQIAVDALFAQ